MRFSELFYGVGSERHLENVFNNLDEKKVISSTLKEVQEMFPVCPLAPKLIKSQKIFYSVRDL
jgi:hypothetical protein